MTLKILSISSKTAAEKIKRRKKGSSVDWRRINIVHPTFDDAAAVSELHMNLNTF